MAKKIILIAIIFLLVFGSTNDIFIKKAEATSVSEAFGKAVGSFIACWATEEISLYLQGVAKHETTGTGLGVARAAQFAWAVPSVEVGSSIAEGKAQSNDAYGAAKNCLRDTFIRIMGDYIVDQIVDWIQNGGSLGDRFVTDWSKFGDDALNVGVGAVFNDSNFKFLCSPFGLQVKLALLPVRKFSTQISCTLDKIVKNINNFYVDFSVGGWDGYLLSLEPQNNFYGTILLMNDEAFMQGKKSKEAAMQDAAAGKGFLSVKRCKDGGSDILAGAQLDYPNDWQFTKASNGYCPSRLVINDTPGALVGDKVSTWTIQKDFQTLINSKDIAVWTQAIIDAAINRVLKEGLSQLKPSKDDDTDFDADRYKNSLNALNYGIAINSIAKLKEKAQQIASSAQFILPIKSQSLSNLNNTFKILNNIQSIQQYQPGVCSPQITNSDISTASSTTSLINNEVANLIVIEGKSQEFLDFANQNSNTDMNILADNVKAFSDMLTSYYNDIQKISDSNAINNANNELADIQTKLNSTQTQFGSCGFPILINTGATSVNSQNVSLILNAFATNISNATQMMISNDSTFLNAVWESYSTTKDWILTSGAGLKTVYVKFSNASSTVSSIFSDNITLQ